MKRALIDSAAWNRVMNYFLKGVVKGILAVFTEAKSRLYCRDYTAPIQWTVMSHVADRVLIIPK